MVNEELKKQVIEEIVRLKDTLGSYSRVAQRLNVSTATVTHSILKSENHSKVSQKMWTDIAHKLGLRLCSKDWMLADINNYKIMFQTLQSAQTSSLFLAVSAKAGSGKTAMINAYKEKDTTNAVFVLQCEEWGQRTFLLKLIELCGIETSKGYEKIHELGERIVTFFKQKSRNRKPILILDEADKLKPAALRFIIHFYNKLEDEAGMVVCGTDNLKKEIKNGVKFSKKGFDEIDSRLGRTYIALLGATLEDVEKIADSNGIKDKTIAKQIFMKSNPVEKFFWGRQMSVVEDIRVVKRKIKAQLIYDNR